MVRRPGALLLVVAALALGSLSRAEAPATVALEYTAPRACPTAGAFASKVTARAPSVKITTTGAPERRLLVRIDHGRGRYAGRVILEEADGTRTNRTVEGSSCTDVVQALAVIAAIAIDPSAADPAKEEPSAGGGAGPGSAGPGGAGPGSAAGAGGASAGAGGASAGAGGASAGAPSGSAAGAASGTPTGSGAGSPPPGPPEPAHPADPRDASAAAGTAPPDQPASPRDGTTARWAFSVGAHGGAVSGIAPNVVLLVPVFAELARSSGSLFAPAVRLRLERTGTGASAPAQFTWTAASLDLCPVAVGTGRFDARPCGRLEAGVLDANGVDVRPARSGSRPWVGVGPVARGRFVLVPPLFAELELAADVPLIRDRFFVQPSSTVFRAPAVGWSATAGLGVRFEP